MKRCVVALTSSSVNEEAYSEVQTHLDFQEATPILIIVLQKLICSSSLHQNFRTDIQML